MNAVETPFIAPVPPAKKQLDARALRRRLLTQIIVLLLVTCGAAITGLLMQDQLDEILPESSTNPSVFNRKPSGISGVREVAEKNGFTCREWVFPYRELSTVKGVLVIIAPSESLAEFESKQILDWVKKGNDLIYLDHFAYKFSRHMLNDLKVGAQDGTAMTDSAVPLTGNKPEFAHVGNLTVSAETRLTGAPALVTDTAGETLFASLKHGKGHIWLGTVPSLVANRRLTAQEQWHNFQFFINLLRSARAEVWFDERCHGYSKNANVFLFLARGATGALFAQILLILAIGVAGASQRFGRLESLSNKRKISSLEFIYGLSNAYKRAHANTATLEILSQSFKTRLCKIVQVSPHEPDTVLIETWMNSQLATESLRQTVQQFLYDSETQLEKKNLSDNELKALIITCDKITEQLKDLSNRHSAQIGKANNDKKDS